MKLYKIMNFVILALVITAVYQTGELWLAGTTSHNFFSLLAEDTSLSSTEADGKVLLATRYAVGEGEGVFSVYYPEEMGTSSFLLATNEVLDEVLSDRALEVEISTADWREILASRCVVLQYDFLLSSADYLRGYRQLRSNEMLGEFDYLTIAPSRRPGEATKVYFVNSQTNEVVCYTTYKSSLASEFYNRLTVQTEGLTYISTGERTGSSIISRNLFLPQWAELPYSYRALKETAPYEIDGAVSRVEMETSVRHFFRNFTMDWNARDEEGSYAFSDNQTVVRYFPDTRVLQYYNYDAYGSEKSSIGLAEGYQIATNFLANDTTLNTDIYLANIQVKGTETVYYFNYVVKDLPITLSAGIQEKIGSAYAIEVTIRNQSVKEYKRYMVNYEEATVADKVLDIQFIDALDEANKTYQALHGETTISDVSDISLGYYVQSTGEIELKWFVSLYEYLFITETNTANLLEIGTGTLAEEMTAAIYMNSEE